jgi:hypothetical protein
MKAVLVIAFVLGLAACASAAVDIETCYDNCFTIEEICPGLHTSCNATCAVNATFGLACVDDMQELVFSANATNNTIILEHSCTYFPSHCFFGYGPKLHSMMPLITNALRAGGPIQSVLEEGQIPVVGMNTDTGEVHLHIIPAAPTSFDKWNEFWDSL